MLPKVSLGPSMIHLHHHITQVGETSSFPHPISPPRHSIDTVTLHKVTRIPFFHRFIPQSSLPSLQEPIPSSSFQEKMLEAFSDIKVTLCSHTQSIAKLETQMGQLAQTLQ